jgi:hypothetical protein
VFRPIEQSTACFAFVLYFMLAVLALANAEVRSDSGVDHIRKSTWMAHRLSSRSPTE